MKSVSDLGKLKMVVLKSPYFLWTQNSFPGFKDLFHEMIALKLKGYGAEYPHGVLPVDTSDFIATHLLVCRQESRALHPLMGFKTTLLSDCEKHRVSFPALGLVQAAEAPSHIRVVKSIMDRCLEEHKKLAYTGSWTIDPEIRQNRPLAKELNRWFNALYVFYHMGNQIDEVITGGTIRFKADIVLQNMGHNPVRNEEGELPPIAVKHLFDEKVSLLHLTKFLQGAIDAAEECREIWEERIEISADFDSSQKRLRAAS